mgnify:CR=1 FL=1
MAKTRVVNIRLESCDCYCGRAGHGEKGTHGNPYTAIHGQSRGATVNKLFRDHFNFKVREDKLYRAELDKLVELKRKQNGLLSLGCFCAGPDGLFAGNPPYTCHAQVIAEYIDEREP